MWDVRMKRWQELTELEKCLPEILSIVQNEQSLIEKHNKVLCNKIHGKLSTNLILSVETRRILSKYPQSDYEKSCCLTIQYPPEITSAALSITDPLVRRRPVSVAGNDLRRENSPPLNLPTQSSKRLKKSEK